MPAEGEQRGGDQGEAADDQPARPELVGEAAGDRRHGDDHQRRGQEPDARFQRRVAEDVLHVEGEEEEDAHHREADDQGDDHGAEEVAVGEQLELDHRRLDPVLDRRRRPAAPVPRSASRAITSGDPQPQLLPSTSDKDQRREAGGEDGDAGVVDVTADRGVARLADREQGRQHGADRDRDVEVEDRPPADVLGEEAAEHRPDRQRQRRDAGPGAHRLAALVGGEGIGDDRERPRHHQRRADALDDAADDQRGLVRGEAGGRRGEGEDDHAGEEHPPAAEDVAEPPAGRQQHGEGERVAVDRPLQARDRGPQVLLDRGQGDVHDRVVEHDHEQREAHRAEGPPLAVLVGDQVGVTGQAALPFSRS